MNNTQQYTEWWNVFVCPSCDYTEAIPASQQRHSMEIEMLDHGDTDEQYAKYKCNCGTEAWSFVEPWTPEECGE